MKYLFWFLFLPLGLLWGWIGLSYHDINLGTQFFSRDMHDLVFSIYAHVLGMEQHQILPLLARACIVDVGIVLAIFAFRRRKQIRAWWAARQAVINGETPQSVDMRPAAPAE